jgi:bifunctional non-homologous end joining protein LigD
MPPRRSHPASVQVERDTPCSAPFDDDGWRFSVDWDGARTILSVDEAGGVRLQAETLADVTDRFPELRFASENVGRRPVVLDGVVVALDGQGRPDIEALGLRVALGEQGAGQRPVVYLATDVLHVGGDATTGRPLATRLELLHALVGHRGVVQAPDTVEGRGIGLAAAAAQRALPAVVARRSSAPYRPGVASPDRLRATLRPRATCAIVGIEEGAERPYLLLGEYDRGRLVGCGRVKGPRHAAVERWLAERAAILAAAEPPAAGERSARFAAAGDTVWLRPGLCATVTHEGRTADGVLREPGLLAIRDDVDPHWCLRRDPVPPPTVASRSFAPTVLLPLPLESGGMLPTRHN